VRDDGVVDITDTFSSRYPDLQAAVVDGAIEELVTAGESGAVSYAQTDVEFLIPIAHPEKLICVGVNFPDRNAEYKDGQAAAARPSLFIRFPRSFTGHEQNLIRPPESV